MSEFKGGVPTLAKLLCEANHTVALTHGMRALQGVPCTTHIAEADRIWFLTQPVGAKSLAVILAANGTVEATFGDEPAEVTLT